MADDVTAVERCIAAWQDAANTGDADSIGKLVADDFEMIPPDEDPVAGSDAHQFLRGFFDYDLTLEQDTLDLAVSGDLALRRYRFNLSMAPKDGGEAQILRGQGIHVLRREPHGEWKFIKDMYNELP